MFASWGTGMQPENTYKTPSEKRKAWESKNKPDNQVNTNFD